MGIVKGVIFWDFDGTLAIMQKGWRAAITDVLKENEPAYNMDSEQIKPFLTGFPWHTPEVPHTHLSTSDKWWQALEPVFERFYQGAGCTPKRAAELAPLVRNYITDARRYRLFEDALPVLASLKKNGWKHAILSNHIPELPGIVHYLGLSSYIDVCISSGITGYEKPNPEAFRLALEAVNNPKKVWMVGDSFITDIKGAEAAGIPAILVHTNPVGDVKHHALTLSGVINVIERNFEIKL